MATEYRSGQSPPMRRRRPAPAWTPDRLLTVFESIRRVYGTRIVAISVDSNRIMSAFVRDRLRTRFFRASANDYDAWHYMTECYKAGEGSWRRV